MSRLSALVKCWVCPLKSGVEVVRFTPMSRLSIIEWKFIIVILWQPQEQSQLSSTHGSDSHHDMILILINIWFQISLTHDLITTWTKLIKAWFQLSLLHGLNSQLFCLFFMLAYYHHYVSWMVCCQDKWYMDCPQGHGTSGRFLAQVTQIVPGTIVMDCLWDNCYGLSLGQLL